jgi:predicted nuclease with TOPRIM domain
MSDTQEKKDVVFVKLSKVQQKKLSIEEQIDYLKKESEQVLLNAKKHQSKLKEEQDKLLKVVKSQERKDDTRRKILLGSWILNKIKHDESFKHQLSDFQQFLNTENKTESNRQKDKDLFKDILF